MQMEQKVWRVAVVGCGMFANGQYLPNIAKEAELVGAKAECVAAVDIIFERAQQACEKFHIPHAYHNVYELIEQCDFDIAIDAASIQAHHEINMAVLGAGKHLVSQKPAAPTVAMLTEQIELAKAKGVRFACAPVHPMRYDIHMAKQWMRDGTIGRPYYVKCNMSHGGPEYFQYRDADPTWFYEDGAGALVDMGVHGLQIVTTLLGPAKTVACTAIVSTPHRTVRSGAFNGKPIASDKIPDQYLITLTFGDGRMALVDSGFSQKASKAPQIEIFGDQGTIAFTKPYMTNPKPDVYMDCPERGIRGWVTPFDWETRETPLNSQCCVLGDLIHGIETGEPLQLPAEHARHLVEIMNKIPEAISSGATLPLETTF